ncbi:MAG: hypothetical protein DRQ59_06710 [Gammaproteobacteria bacterium]|nr:MAG: hypothetical protein DRQ59_06710 [Gammaproteobacteria bacterium]
MADDTDIPVLTELIGKGIEIKLSELGLSHSPLLDKQKVLEPLQDSLALEQEIRRILDEHMELAWQEIKIAIQAAGVNPPTDTDEYLED